MMRRLRKWWRRNVPPWIRRRPQPIQKSSLQMRMIWNQWSAWHRRSMVHTSSSAASFLTSLWGSMFLTSCLQQARFCVSSPDKSTFTLSIHLRFGLPFLLLSSTSILTTLLHIFFTHPFWWHHFNLLSRAFLDVHPTFVVPLILSFLILSIYFIWLPTRKRPLGSELVEFELVPLPTSYLVPSSRIRPLATAVAAPLHPWWWLRSNTPWVCPAIFVLVFLSY